jgi:hypothetical protein
MTASLVSVDTARLGQYSALLASLAADLLRMISKQSHLYDHQNGFCGHSGAGIVQSHT